MSRKLPQKRNGPDAIAVMAAWAGGGASASWRAPGVAYAAGRGRAAPIGTAEAERLGFSTLPAAKEAAAITPNVAEVSEADESFRELLRCVITLLPDGALLSEEDVEFFAGFVERDADRAELAAEEVPAQRRQRQIMERERWDVVERAISETRLPSEYMDQMRARNQAKDERAAADASFLTALFEAVCIDAGRKATPAAFQHFSRKAAWIVQTDDHLYFAAAQAARAAPLDFVPDVEEIAVEGDWGPGGPEAAIAAGGSNANELGEKARSDAGTERLAEEDEDEEENEDEEEQEQEEEVDEVSVEGAEAGSSEQGELRGGVERGDEVESAGRIKAGKSRKKDPYPRRGRTSAGTHELSLTDCQLGPRALRVLGEYIRARHRQAECLNLDKNTLGDEGAQVLAETLCGAPLGALLSDLAASEQGGRRASSFIAADQGSGAGALALPSSVPASPRVRGMRGRGSQVIAPSAISAIHAGVAPEGSAEPAPSLSQLRHLSVRANGIGPAGCFALSAGLSSVPSLRSLDLSSLPSRQPNTLGERGGAALAKLLQGESFLSQGPRRHSGTSTASAATDATSRDNCPKLRSLSLGSVGQAGIAVLATRGLAGNTSLRMLDVRANRLDDHVMAALCNALKQTRVRVLNLARNPFGARGGEAIAALIGESRFLSDLSLAHCEGSLTLLFLQQLRDALPRTGTLTRLCLDHCEIGVKSTVSALGAALQRGQTLTSVSLRKCCISHGEGLAAWVRRAPRLRELLLRDNLLSDAGARELCDAVARNQSRTLRTLELASNGIGDDSRAALVELLRSASLTRLDLRANLLHDATLAALGDTVAQHGLVIALDIDANSGSATIASYVARAAERRRMRRRLHTMQRLSDRSEHLLRSLPDVMHRLVEAHEQIRAARDELRRLQRQLAEQEAALQSERLEGEIEFATRESEADRLTQQMMEEERHVEKETQFFEKQIADRRKEVEGCESKIASSQAARAAHGESVRQMRGRLKVEQDDAARELRMLDAQLRAESELLSNWRNVSRSAEAKLDAQRRESVEKYEDALTTYMDHVVDHPGIPQTLWPMYWRETLAVKGAGDESRPRWDALNALHFNLQRFLLWNAREGEFAGWKIPEPVRAPQVAAQQLVMVAEARQVQPRSSTSAAKGVEQINQRLEDQSHSKLDEGAHSSSSAATDAAPPDSPVESTSKECPLNDERIGPSSPQNAIEVAVGGPQAHLEVRVPEQQPAECALRSNAVAEDASQEDPAPATPSLPDVAEEPAIAARDEPVVDLSAASDDRSAILMHSTPASTEETESTTHFELELHGRALLSCRDPSSKSQCHHVREATRSESLCHSSRAPGADLAPPLQPKLSGTFETGKQNEARTLQTDRQGAEQASLQESSPPELAKAAEHRIAALSPRGALRARPEESFDSAAYWLALSAPMQYDRSTQGEEAAAETSLAPQAADAVAGMPSLRLRAAAFASSRTSARVSAILGQHPLRGFGSRGEEHAQLSDTRRSSESPAFSLARGLFTSGQSWNPRDAARLASLDHLVTEIDEEAERLLAAEETLELRIRAEEPVGVAVDLVAGSVRMISRPRVQDAEDAAFSGPGAEPSSPEQESTEAVAQKRMLSSTACRSSVPPAATLSEMLFADKAICAEFARKQDDINRLLQVPRPPSARQLWVELCGEPVRPAPRVAPALQPASHPNRPHKTAPSSFFRDVCEPPRHGVLRSENAAAPSQARDRLPATSNPAQQLPRANAANVMPRWPNQHSGAAACKPEKAATAAARSGGPRARRVSKPRPQPVPREEASAQDLAAPLPLPDRVVVGGNVFVRALDSAVYFALPALPASSSSSPRSHARTMASPRLSDATQGNAKLPLIVTAPRERVCGAETVAMVSGASTRES